MGVTAFAGNLKRGKKQWSVLAGNAMWGGQKMDVERVFKKKKRGCIRGRARVEKETYCLRRAGKGGAMGGANFSLGVCWEGESWGISEMGERKSWYNSRRNKM